MTRYSPNSFGALRAEVVERLCELQSPRLEADLIISHYAERDRSWLHAHMADDCGSATREAVLNAAARRAKREPLQYILGECDFDGLSVIVAPGCLVPRPETELLVDCAARYFDGTAFLDWGTGTGCIALALLKRFPDARAIMAEKNRQSIDCARLNLAKFSFVDRAKIVESQTPDDIPQCEVSLIVSNPPYVPSGEIDSLMPEISLWEPRLALDGGADGLVPYAGLFGLALRILRPRGIICVEYGGESQTEALRALVPCGFDELELVRDFAGHDRVLCWRRA